MKRGAIKFIVVMYDIADDKRRTRLHKALKRFGAATQYSVFECLLNDTLWAELRAAVAAIVEPEDDLRYYELCAGCHRQTATLGIAIRTTLKSVYIV